MTTNQQKQELWQRRVKACEDSRVSIVVYCKGAGINQHTFKYWQKKFKNETKKKSDVVAANFIRVVPLGTRAPTPTPTPVARLRFGQGVVLECLVWPETKWLAEFGKEHGQ